jgi:TRAP-type mannitol/chloroaromatic compound transport system permease small subunit
MKNLLKIMDQISIWTGKLSSVIVFVVAVVVVYEVTMRYLLHLPTLWASEAMGIGCALIYILGGAWVIQENKHVRIETLYERVSPRTRAAMDVGTYLFFVLYTGVMTWATTKYAWKSFLLRETSGSPWDPPVYPIKFALAFGFLLLLLQGTVKFLRDIYFLTTRREP